MNDKVATFWSPPKNKNAWKFARNNMIYTDTARNNADAFEGSGSGDAKMKEEKERFFFFF